MDWVVWKGGGHKSLDFSGPGEQGQGGSWREVINRRAGKSQALAFLEGIDRFDGLSYEMLFFDAFDMGLLACN